MSYDDRVLGGAPTAYWRLNEQSGSVAAEQFGSNGAYVGGPTLGSASLIATNYAVKTTSSSYVSLPAPVSFGHNFTLVGWFEYVSGSSPLFRDSTSGAAGWLFDISGTNPVVRAGGLDHTITSVTSASLKTGRHRVAWTGDGSTHQLYIDRTLVDSWANSAGADQIAWPLLLGKNGTDTGYSPTVFAAFAHYPYILGATRLADDFDAADEHDLGTIAVTVAPQSVPVSQTIPLGAAYVTVTALPAPAVHETLRYLGTATISVIAQPIAVSQTFHPGSPLVLTSYTTADIDEPLADPDLDAPNLVIAPLHVVSPSVPTPTLVDGRPQ